MNVKDVSILLIDDEHEIVNLLTTFLKKNGYNVTGLTDSNKALQVIKDTPIHIILTDLKMPKVTGMDIIKAVVETQRDTQVIIFTAYATIDSAIEAIKFGVNEYIRKPFHIEEIIVALERAAEKLIL